MNKDVDLRTFHFVIMFTRSLNTDQVQLVLKCGRIWCQKIFEWVFCAA